MENNERKLGRGLSALIGESRVKHKILEREDNNTENIKLVKIDKIKAGKYQPRKHFSEDKINELAESISNNGILQPIILRKIDEEGGYEIIAGERRFRATIKAGLKEIPAIIKKLNNHQALELAIVENVQRSDLTVVEEAQSYKKLMQEFSYTQEQVAQKVGKSRSHVANNLRLLTLPESIQNLLNDDSITMGHARAIIKAENKEDFIKDIIENKLTVRDVEDLIRTEKSTQKKAGTKRDNQNIDKEQLTTLEKSIDQNSGLKSKITYNELLNKGKIVIKFNDLEKLKEFIKNIEKK